MKQIRSTIDIPAGPELVWQVLTDTGELARWNPFLTQLDGTLEVGERLQITVRPGDRTMSFRPRVVAVEPGRVLRWQGRLGVPGIFDGLHELRLEPIATGTRFVHSESFRGLLVPVLGRVLADTEQGFVAMNEALPGEVARRAGTDAT